MRQAVLVVISALTVVALTSCASKKKTDDVATGDMSGDSVVSDSAMSFDPQGSDSGKIPGLSTVYFEYDQASLSSEARTGLASNADWIKGNSNSTIQVEGHCDNRGSIEYNLALGERRAQSVKNYLVSLGIDGKRLTIISYGEEKPIVDGESEAAWSKNRRANFVPLRQ